LDLLGQLKIVEAAAERLRLLLKNSVESKAKWRERAEIATLNGLDALAREALAKESNWSDFIFKLKSEELALHTKICDLRERIRVQQLQSVKGRLLKIAENIQFLEAALQQAREEGNSEMEVDINMKLARAMQEGRSLWEETSSVEKNDYHEASDFSESAVRANLFHKEVEDELEALKRKLALEVNIASKTQEETVASDIDPELAELKRQIDIL
jgi:hypothetical protein